MQSHPALDFVPCPIPSALQNAQTDIEYVTNKCNGGAHLPSIKSVSLFCKNMWVRK